MQKAKIFEFVESMAALIRAEERKRCAELRIQLVHFEVLNYLSHTNQYTDTPAATASYFGMTRGTVSQTLIVLEKKGYIEKNKDETDKRIIHVKILPSGQTIIKKVRRIELFDKATFILKQSNSTVIQKKFVKVFQALQKASSSHSFSTTIRKNKHNLKKLTICDLIELMATLIRSEERKRCSELKLQMVHFQVLEFLSLSNKYSDTPAAIANYFGMTRGTVSQSLIILENRGYIKKIQDHDDKRIFHVQLLEPGINTLRKAKPADFFEKASEILSKDSPNTTDGEEIFIKALIALQKANNSYSFGVCKTCKNFTLKSSGSFCDLTQEELSTNDRQKICQEHIPI